MVEDDQLVDGIIGKETVFSSEAIQIKIQNTAKETITKTGEELIERFVRGDASRHSEGSGLGLAITQQLLELKPEDISPIEVARPKPHIGF